MNSFENIERKLLNRMVSFELAKVNMAGTIPSRYWKVNDMIEHNSKPCRLDRIERVEKYERLFDEAAISHDPEKLRLLNAYYTSGEWQEDYEADERSELPPDLKRGILSQDALYDLLQGTEL